MCTVAAAATKQAPPRGATPEPFILASGIVDYYTLLGVDDFAPAAEIKQAYRTLAKARAAPLPCWPGFPAFPRAEATECKPTRDASP